MQAVKQKVNFHGSTTMRIESSRKVPQTNRLSFGCIGHAGYKERLDLKKVNIETAKSLISFFLLSDR